MSKIETLAQSFENCFMIRLKLVQAQATLAFIKDLDPDSEFVDTYKHIGGLERLQQMGRQEIDRLLKEVDNLGLRE